LELAITVNNIQHVIQQHVVFNLSQNKITCITGKNSVGKTTLIRAIRNLAINSTFQETAAPYIFNEGSSITYSVEGLENDIEFTYNRFLKGVDSKQEIPDELKSLISVELPIPHGERFNHFRRLADIDEELRAKIALGEYTSPEELISFLHRVYSDDRFANLKQVNLKKTVYYFILKDEAERYYIREDYFSSGEYFVVNLYKHIRQQKKLIVIDEIDISLDASAQVNLVRVLREFCNQYETNIVFTTHSLALMKTLESDELHYMEQEQGSELTTINPRSYNFVKSIMYGFSGSDRYILTEDECLENYVNYLISSSGQSVFFKFKIIYVAGGTQVIDLMKRNARDNFLSIDEHVLSVLDGDQSGERYLNGIDKISFLPFPSIEKEIYQRYLENDENIPTVESIEGKTDSKRAKNLFWKLTRVYGGEQLMSFENIYTYLEKLNPDGVESFRQQLLSFLNP